MNACTSAHQAFPPTHPPLLHTTLPIHHCLQSTRYEEPNLHTHHLSAPCFLHSHPPLLAIYQV